MATQIMDTQGQDNACDPRPTSQALLSLRQGEEDLAPAVEAGSQLTDEEEPFLPVSMPVSSSGYVTFGYERALRNRIPETKISRHGEYSARAYTPTFVHDCLMLPGSLANVLGKGSQEDILQQMTPALLPGFYAHVHSETREPCILQSPDSHDHVQGMLILGLSRRRRDRIHQHYRPHVKRIKVQVELDVLIEGPSAAGPIEQRFYELKRRRVWAHVWLWSNIDTGEVYSRTGQPRWTLEDYIAGTFDPVQRLRIEPDGRGDERQEGEAFDEEDGGVECDAEQREVVFSGPGLLDYARSDGFTGW